MFGIGPQELLIIGLLLLVIFGPGKAAGMARDFGRFVSGAQSTVEEFKNELLSEEVREARRTVKEFGSELSTTVADFKDEARHSMEGLKAEGATGEEETEVAGDPSPNEEDGEPRLEEGRERPRKEEAPPPSGVPAQTE